MGKVKKMLSAINSGNPEVVYFNPPQMFMQLKMVDYVEIEKGDLLTVSSSGPTFFYRVDSDVEAFFASRTPDISL